MNIFIRSFGSKSLLALGLAAFVMVGMQAQPVAASHKKAAIIAGAIIGGAILYRHHKKHRKYRRNYRQTYYGNYYRGHKHRHYHRNRGHYHRYYHRHSIGGGNGR